MELEKFNEIEGIVEDNFGEVQISWIDIKHEILKYEGKKIKLTIELLEN